MYRHFTQAQGHIKFPQFARFFYDKLGSILSPDARLNGNVLSFLNLSGKNFRRKKFSREEIFATWHSIAKITKISTSRKFPAMWYTVEEPSKLRKFYFGKRLRSTRLSSPQLRMDLELACSLWDGSYHQQLLTQFDKCVSLLQSLQRCSASLIS